MIIGRSTSQQEIDTRIDQLAEEFQKAECPGEIPELESEGSQYSGGLGVILPGSEKMDRPPPFQIVGVGWEGKEERPKKKRIGRSKPLEVELDLSGEFRRGNMSRPSQEDENEARVVSANDFKHQEDLKMYIQLPDYGDFLCYDLGVGGMLS